MGAYEPGSYVWYDHPEETWTPAKVLSGAPDAVNVVLMGTGEELTFPNSSGKFMRMNKQNLSPAPDMVKLGDLHEAALLHNLRLRFSTDDMFTYIGPILVACNPYKRLPIFTLDIMRRYHTASAAETLDPHVYGLANNVYANMLRDGENQSVVISGESGAGKTEETKLCLEFLAAVASDDRATSKPEQLLLKSSPILEAMGNAKTIRNNNSSRFGKYMQVRFNKRGKIIGGSIIKYLLEKGRVVRPGSGERNYHIFYLMNFLMKDEQVSLSYDKPENFRFCSCGGVTTVDGIDDESEMAAFRDAWDTMGVHKDEVQSLYRVVAAVLHLGNLSFQTNDEDQARLGSGPLSTVAALFESEADELERTLTVRSMKSGGKSSEVVRIPLTVQQAIESQEGLAKAAYSRVFDWVVSRLNTAIESPAGEVTQNTIGVLDIFGFEIFEENSFEQLCINLANEKLQGHFNNHIFKLEMQVYAAEGLDLTKISFADNQPIIDLIEKKPSGLFPMIDEECVVPKGDDASLLGKLQDLHSKNKYWSKPRAKSRADQQKLQFVVMHYAGRVVYSANGFLTKNRDLLHPDLEGYMASSASSFVRALFPPSEGQPKRGRAPTLGGQFRVSLQKLYEKLTSTAPHFIKCVKTNELKQANTFDSRYCLQQVEYLGLLEVVRIRRQGYPVRRTPEAFVRRYAMLAESCPREAGALLHSVGTSGLWQLGKTMVFMKDEQLTLLEAARAVCLDQSVRILQQALASFVKLARWRKVLGGFKLLAPICRGGYARALVPKIRTVKVLTDNLQQAMNNMTPRFPPSPDISALVSAMNAAHGAPSSHGLTRVHGYDELLRHLGEASSMQNRVSLENAVLCDLRAALDEDDEQACLTALDEAAQMVPPMTADPSQADSLLNQAAVYVRNKAEARQLAAVRENAAEILENLSFVLAIDVEAVAAESKSPKNDDVSFDDTSNFPIATAMQKKRNAIHRAIQQARECGAGADPRVAECEIVAREIDSTIDALSGVVDAVASGDKEELIAALSGIAEHDLGPAGVEATQAVNRGLLEIQLSEELHELEQEHQALRGLGGRLGEEKVLEARIEATIDKAARAGICLERSYRPRTRVQVQPQRTRHPMLHRAVLANEPYVVQLEKVSAQFADLETFPRLVAMEFSFRATGLSKPLTSIPAPGYSSEERMKLESKAIDAFSSLLGWCGAVWHPQPAQLGAALLVLCSSEPQLRDELYMQLMMQCGADNPDAFIARRCWQMLALYMSSRLPPSAELRPYVLAFLVRTIRGTIRRSLEDEKMKQNHNEEVHSGLPGASLSGDDVTTVGIAQRCLAVLSRTPARDGVGSVLPANGVPESLPPDNIPTSRRLPDAAELEEWLTRNDDALEDEWVHVYLPDGTHRSFAVDDDTTVCELLLTMSVSLRLVHIDTYALYEVKSRGDGRNNGFNSLERNGTLSAVALDPRINILSQLRDWKRSLAPMTMTSGPSYLAAGVGAIQPAVESPRRLVLSKRLHVERAADVAAAAAHDPVLLHLLYAQALGCVIRGKCAPEEQGVAVDLAALSIQAQRGDYDPKVHTSDFLRTELVKHIPPVQLGSRKLSGWEISLIAGYRKLSGMSARKAKEEYVKRCMADCSGFGVTLFRATQTHRSDIAQTVLLGVSVEGVTVREPKALKIVVERYRLQKLTSWAAGANGAVHFKVLPDPGHHEIDESVRYVLDGSVANNSGRELCSLLRDYALWFAARRKREQARCHR